MLFDRVKYVNKIAETPKQAYEGLVQATLNDQWDNTTHLYTIQEQDAYPFEDSYHEIEAYVDAISDDLINYSKVYSDFVQLWFRDIHREPNYKGQYYKINLDGTHEETYICYDRINSLTQVADTKCVRCNNVLTWLNSDGTICKYPCYLGTDISSTNNLVSKDGIISNARMIILVQANDYTKSIVKNQRFLFQHTTAFKVEEVNNYMQEQGTDGEVTCIKIYVANSPILPIDNLALNLCDYEDSTYTLTINQQDVNQVNGFTEQLTATVKLNDSTQDVGVVWESSNEDVVTINMDGQYTIVGNVGDVATIKCYMLTNPLIYDTIQVNVVQQTISDSHLVVYPQLSRLTEKSSVDLTCEVYFNGVKRSDDVICVAHGADTSCYDLVRIDNGYRLTNNKYSAIPLTLTFSANDCSDVILTINLDGLL